MHEMLFFSAKNRFLDIQDAALGGKPAQKMLWASVYKIPAQVGKAHYYYYVKYLGTTWALCFCPTVGTEACPGEEQVLNLTTRPWQGPPRSFFYCEAFPELEMRAPT